LAAWWHVRFPALGVLADLLLCKRQTKLSITHKYRNGGIGYCEKRFCLKVCTYWER
jgi:hypothetical protein